MNKENFEPLKTETNDAFEPSQSHPSKHTAVHLDLLVLALRHCFFRIKCAIFWGAGKGMNSVYFKEYLSSFHYIKSMAFFEQSVSNS